MAFFSLRETVVKYCDVPLPSSSSKTSLKNNYNGDKGRNRDAHFAAMPENHNFVGVYNGQHRNSFTFPNRW